MDKHLPALSVPKGRKKPRISKKLRRALDAIATGRVNTRKAAAELVGLSPDHISRMLNRPEIRAVLREKAEQNISDATMRASSLMGELLTCDSDHVKAKVGLRLLESDRLISPQGVGSGLQINNYGRAGFIVDWSNSRNGPSRELTDEEREELARGGAGFVLKPLPAPIDVTPEPEGGT